MEEIKDDVCQPPATASSQNNRFQRGGKKNDKRGNSTLRRPFDNSVSIIVGTNNNNQDKPAKTVRGSLAVVPTSTSHKGQQPLQVSQTANTNIVAMMTRPQSSPEKKIQELQKMKKELKMQRRQQEGEITAIQNKENSSSVKKSMMLRTVVNADIITH